MTCLCRCLVTGFCLGTTTTTTDVGCTHEPYQRRHVSRRRCPGAVEAPQAVTSDRFCAIAPSSFMDEYTEAAWMSAICVFTTSQRKWTFLWCGAAIFTRNVTVTDGRAGVLSLRQETGVQRPSKFITLRFGDENCPLPHREEFPSGNRVFPISNDNRGPDKPISSVVIVILPQKVHPRYVPRENSRVPVNGLCFADRKIHRSNTLQ